MDFSNHKFKPSILKAYDIRGIYGVDFNNTDAYFMGKAYGTFLNDLNRKASQKFPNSSTFILLLKTQYLILQNSNFYFKILYNFKNLINDKYTISNQIFKVNRLLRPNCFLQKNYLRNLSNKKTCVVGMDGRNSSEELKKHFIDGLLKTGIDAYDIGMVMSPCMYWAVWHLNADAGMIITASHNPGEYNGFKMLTKEDPVWGDDIQKIGKIAENGNFSIGNGKLKKFNVKNDYINYVLSFLKLTPNSKVFNIIFDTGNGVVADIIHDVAKHIPGKHKFLYDTVDGTFPNHLADPSLEEEMQDLKNAVISGNYDFGISYDGDGDRLGLIDKDGYIYFGDEILDILMRPFLKENPGEKVLFEISSSQVLVDDIEKFGGIPVMWKPGHSVFKAKMKEDNIKIGGETSCHIYYGENHNFDDSLVATMKMINFLANGNDTLESIRKTFPKTYLTKKIKIRTIDDVIKYEVPDRIAERMKSKGRKVIQIDGARVYVNKSDWWLIRSSNTEPAMTARAEAMTLEGLENCKKELKEQLKLEGFDI